MMYIKFLLLAILDIAFNVVCYLTNPIVVLFGSEYGNLPWLLTWWDNYDDCMDVEWFIKEGHVPSCCVYDYDKHYKFHSNTESQETRGIYKSYVDILDPNFTLKERLQRYACRVLWLYRNCAYGFSYYVTGIDIRKADIFEIKTEEKKVEPVKQENPVVNIPEEPFELKEEKEEAICKKLLATTSFKEMEMHYAINPDLLGGMQIRIGDRVVDSSIQTKLNQLQRDLLKVQV